MNAYAILMAGGVGTRFWPRSRKEYPKQVLNISGEDTMIQATYKRLSGLIPDKNVMVVTSGEQKTVIHSQLSQLSEESFLVEPVGRNTAPCIGLAAVHILQQDPDGIMVVLPADHLVTNVTEFKNVIRLAVDFVSKHDGLLTLGITPDGPVTGYGYIQAGEEVFAADKHQVHRVRTFAEKPNLETAERFLESGDFFWNSGMFIWKASVILKEISEKLPEMYEMLMEVKESINTPHYQENLEAMYDSIRGVSIDVGIMQEAEKVFVIPANMGWNDIGSWETVYEISSKDKQMNAGEAASIINIDSRKCYVYSPEKIVVLVGVEDLIVVDTGDAILICDKSRAQDVRDAVETIRKRGGEKWL